MLVTNYIFIFLVFFPVVLWCSGPVLFVLIVLVVDRIVFHCIITAMSRQEDKSKKVASPEP